MGVVQWQKCGADRARFETHFPSQIWNQLHLQIIFFDANIARQEGTIHINAPFANVYGRRSLFEQQEMGVKIRAIAISVFELPANTGRFRMNRPVRGRASDDAARNRAVNRARTRFACENRRGCGRVCTVGDARYTAMRAEDLAQLRLLTIGEDPFDRERLVQKLHRATRGMFTRPGWFGAFDNCLWDIIGKVAGLPVCALIVALGAIARRITISKVAQKTTP